jgi:adenosylcobyric acid synthase
VPVKGGLLVAGTSSDCGKSVMVAGVCRWLARRGVKVAPFKAQNMALNSAVTREGYEIGRAQAAQAAAAGVEPEAAMNPILLKPTGERTSQVVVMGRPYGEVDARSYRRLTPTLTPVVHQALASLRDRFDVVICEGSGSPAEINLRAGDLVNMGLARAARLPVVVVGDIDRGGVFASLFGTLALLDGDDQRLVAGFLINKFRGERSILEPGLEELTRRTGRAVLGVVPWVRGLWLDAEDSLALDAPRDPDEAPLGRDPMSVAVIRLPRMSNFTDFDPLAAEPGVEVRFTESAADVAGADLVILPGSKATVDDLAWLRGRGLAGGVVERARRGLPLVGICGGYQMFGKRIVDHVERRGDEVEGLSLLPVETVFEEEKVLTTPSGAAIGFGGAECSGYEIHHGRTRRFGGEPLFSTAGDGEGCRLGAVLGTSWHGVFESDEFRRALLAWVATERGLDFQPGHKPFSEVRRERLDLLADLIEHHVDEPALLGLIEGGAPGDLPVLTVARGGGQ